MRFPISLWALSTTLHKEVSLLRRRFEIGLEKQQSAETLTAQ